jgi:hypothetical protein
MNWREICDEEEGRHAGHVPPLAVDGYTFGLIPLNMNR